MLCPIRPLYGEGVGAKETVVGILYAYTGIVHRAVMCAVCSEGIEAVKEVVGGGHIMLSEDVVSKVQTGDRGEIGRFLHVCDADERHLEIGVPFSNLTTDDVP